MKKKRSTLMAYRHFEGLLQNSEQHAVAHCPAHTSTKLTPELDAELLPPYRAFFFLLLASRTYVRPRLRSLVRSPGSEAM